MNTEQQKKKSNLMLVGVIVVLSIFFLAGNASIVSGVGRYQLDSWGYSDGKGTGMHGAFVIDTATGTTQIVYREKITNSTQLVIENSLGKHFNSYNNKIPANGRSIKEVNKLFNIKSSMEKPG